LLQNKKKFLEVRSRLSWAVRTFFHSQGFVEVDTPVRIPTPALEDYIDAVPYETNADFGLSKNFSDWPMF
jgi:elongation factor P--(R)-beta-lysine ligase